MGLTAEQLELRKRGLGGSDAPVVVGLSPFKSPVQLWMEKRGMEADDEETEEMYWGSILEEPIANAWAEKTGRKIRRMPTRFSKDHPHMLVNVDRQILGDPRGPGYLEVKNFGYWSGRGIYTEDDVHDYVKVQVQHGLAVTGWQWGAYAILIGGNRLFEGETERDDSVIQLLIDAEKEFWRMVVDGIQPEMDGNERTANYLKRLYPKDNGEYLEIETPRIKEMADELVRSKDQLKKAEEEAEKLKNSFKALMGDHQILRIPGWGGLEWKNNKTDTKSVFDEDTFKEKEPDMYMKYQKSVKTGGNRVFRICEGKDYDNPKKKKGRKPKTEEVAA